MPGGAALTRAGEDVEPFTQVGEDLRRGEAAGADRGQLDRQRQPVETPAELRDGRVQRQLHPEVAGSGQQQRHRGRVLHPLRLVGVGYGERGQRQHPLAGDVEGLAAGGEHPHPRAGGREPGGGVGGRVQHVLAVVQHERPLPRRQPDERRVEGREADGPGDRGGDVLAAVHPGQLADGGIPGSVGRGGQGERGLADPAHPRHRDEPAGGQQRAQRRELAVPAQQHPGSLAAQPSSR